MSVSISSRAFRYLLPALLIAGLVLCYHDVIFLGRTLLTTNYVQGTSPTGIGSYGYEGRPPEEASAIDPAGASFLHEPDARMARTMVWKGELPLWNPHLACGIPFLAEMSSALLFPLQWILIISDAPWVWDAYMLLRLFLAGVFAALYLRAMGLGRMATLFGAYAYMLCGYHVWNVNLVFVNSSMLLPLLLLAAEKAARAPCTRTVAYLSAAVAIQILAGTPEPSAFALLFGGCYLVHRSIALGEGRRSIATRIGRATVAAFLGLGLSAPLWIPFVEWLPISHHAHGRGVGVWATGLASLPQLFAPHALGTLWRQWDGSLSIYDPGYAGAVVCALALAAALHPTGRRGPWSFFAVVALLCIFKIYGLPGFNWIVGNLPLFDRVYVTRFLGPVLYFSLSLLAAVSVDRILRGELLPIRVASACLLLAIGASLWGLYPAARYWGAASWLLRGLLAPTIITLSILAVGEARRRGWVSAPFLVAGLSVLLLIDLFLPVPRTRLDRADPFVEPPYVRFLKERLEEDRFRVFGLNQILHPNTAGAYALDDIGSNYPILVGRYVRWLETVMGLEELHSNIVSGSAHLDLDTVGADLLNLKYVIAAPTGKVWEEQGPRSDVLPENLPVGEILPNREVGQTFLSPQDQLTAVSVFFAIFGRENRGTIVFRLYEGFPDGQPIREATVRMEAIRENEHHFFRFDPVANSRERRYSFTVTSPDASLGNAITVWMHAKGLYPDGVRLEWGAPVDGDLGFAIYYDQPDSRYRLVYDEEVKIYENTRCLPRAYVATHALWPVDDHEAFALVRDGNFDPLRTVILEGKENGTRETASGGGRSTISRARIHSYEANRVAITVESDAPGHLVLLDVHYPGWRATVNGEPRRILTANGLFRAVPIEAGRHEVVFRYRPTSLLLGILLAIAAAVDLIWLTIRDRSRIAQGAAPPWLVISRPWG